MARDNVDLICSIGELAALFEQSASLPEFLQKIVDLIAFHMKAAVCSVYLLEEPKQELVLSATQGLNRSSIGHVRLKLGEGITGQALAELRPIREGNGRRNPHFKLIPGLNEETFTAFLAVPIVRGLSRVGVIVVQDPVADYFSENDEKALRAIAAQLASTIENAKLLMSLSAAPAARRDEAAPPRAELKFVKGITASVGFAHGPAVLLGHLESEEFEAYHGEHAHTVADFQRALAQTETQLDELQQQMEKRMADVASLIFSAHLLMLKDGGFSGEMLKRMENGEDAPAAVRGVVQKYVDLFSRSPNPMLREKVLDVRDLGHRLLHNLFAWEADKADYNGQIVICGELLPSDILKLVAQRASALVLVEGGVSSHVSILARSLQIPMVIAKEKRLLDLPENTPVLLDADQGNIFVNPAPDVLKTYDALNESRHKAAELERTVRPSTATLDGERVQLMANINLLSDLAVAKRLKAEGVGLYRSELPFIVRNDFPSEEEQFRIYRRIVEEMDGKEVVFRTLDIGGDKMLSYFPNVSEANPFLGLRAIRFSLRYRDIFTQQLRALLRAAAGTSIRIMFPLVSSVDDFVQARDVLADCSRMLTAENIPHNAEPELGVMIELPSAVEVAPDLAREADFLCIGSNDLVQYVLAVDRTNEQIADLYIPHHPAVLRALKRVAEAAREAGIDLSVCGDMATDARLIPFLLGIGIRRLSMDSRRIPKAQECISGISMEDARRTADTLLRLSRIREVEEYLNR